MKKHTVQQNGDVLATAVEKNMLELAWEHPYLAHLIATVQGRVKKIDEKKNNSFGKFRFFRFLTELMLDQNFARFIF